MPDSFKIFIGKIPEKTAAKDIRPLFEKYGKVLECDVVKNYGFVHMEDPSAGYEAIKNLNGSVVNGVSITVEEAKSRKRPTSLPTIKIFVGNIAEGVKVSDIRGLFSKYGTVAECDLVRNYGFVHIDTSDLTKLLKELNGYVIGGQALKVQISTSYIRQKPGMGNPQQCYNVMPGQAHFLGDPMHMMPPRGAYHRDMYPPPPPPPPPSHNPAMFIRDRGLSGYSVPDPREYYDPYYQGGIDPYDDYITADRRDVGAAVAYPSAGGSISAGADYDLYGRRSPNAASIAHYATDGRTYDDYRASEVPYSYPEQNWTSYGDYAGSAISSAPLADPYSGVGDRASMYSNYSSSSAGIIPVSSDRRADRRAIAAYSEYSSSAANVRDGSSRSSVRYAPY